MAKKRTKTTPNNALACFLYGVRVAEHLASSAPRPGENESGALIRVMREVANGELTLWDTPEEVAPSLPPGSEIMKAGELARALRDARRREQETAQEVWAAFLKEVGR
jgi:hypothetical protein